MTKSNIAEHIYGLPPLPLTTEFVLIWACGFGFVALWDWGILGVWACEFVGLWVRVLCVLRLCVLWICGFVGLCVSVACLCLFVCCVLCGNV